MGDEVDDQKYFPAVLFPEAEQPKDQTLDDQSGNEGGGQPGEKPQERGRGLLNRVGLPVIDEMADEWRV